jgi:hypothetical protein
MHSSARADAGVLRRSLIDLAIGTSPSNRFDSRYGVIDDFPRRYPWTFRKIRVGFTDMSRSTDANHFASGQVVAYPTRNFATLGPL